MFKHLFIIYIFTQITLVSSIINYSKLSDKMKKELKQKWEACCRENTCISNSCYMVQWSKSTWSSVRQRCQSQYPEWPEAVDIFRIKNEADLRIFWDMLQNPLIPVRQKPKTVWTSGTRCPKTTPNGKELVPSWVSTDEPFQQWLIDKASSSSHSGSVYNKRCEFLAVSPAASLQNVKYDFQDQNAHHSAICEFSVPGAEWITVTDSSTVETTKKQQTPVTIMTDTENIEPDDTTTTKMTEKETTTKIADTKTPGVPAHKINSIAYKMSSPSTHSEDLSKIFSTKIPQMCKAVNESEIYWPETPAGKFVKRKCPKGMTGIAKWQCDKDGSWSEKPEIEGCKHEWIEHIEDSIKRRDDAVEISSRLARETKHNNMSHGDVIALVNLTAKLFQLYIEQKGEEEFETTEGEEKPTYYNFTKTTISSISNILREEIKHAWEGLNEDRQTKEASTILKLVTSIGSRLSCIKVSSEKLQFTVSEENIDLQTFILNNTDKTDDIVRFPEETEGVKANSFIALPANVRVQTWSSPCKNYKSAVGVMYRHVGDFLKAGQQKSNTTTRIATEVLGFSLTNTTESISLSEGSVSITLKHDHRINIEQIPYQNPPRCVFWNFSKSAFGEWDDSGCTLVTYNETHTVCKCDHLTNFAALFDIHNRVEKNTVLSCLTYVCCGFSCVSLLLTIVCFIAIRSLHGRRSIITGNLSFALFVSNGLIIFGLDKTHNKTLCAVIAGFLHYWLLSAFFWMLVEGYHLYRMVILVFQRGSNISVKWYYFVAYGTPLIIVGISAFLGYSNYGTSKFCWLSPGNYFIWSFVGPVCLIILVNLLIFVLTLRSASSVKIKKEQSTVKRMKSWIRGSFSVMCLLGLTWTFGLVIVDEISAYIFTILNGLQGVFIFLFHIILNDKVSSFFSCKNKSMKGRKKFLNHISSNQTHSKTSTRTSTNSLGCQSSTKISDNQNITNHQILPDPRSSRSRAKSESSEAGKRNFRRNKVSHTLSNGLRSHVSPCDVNVRVRSASASNYQRNIQISQKSRLAPF